MKVIFLDIDGVLNVYCEGRDKYGCTFHEHFQDNLAYIIQETAAKIVISSTWRTDGLKKMQNMWIDRGLAGEVIDCTPTSHDLVVEGKFVYYDLVDRGHEIQEWLDNHPEVENYVILDDDNDMLDSQMGFFVRTANNRGHPDCVDIGYGLTRICADKAIEILNKDE